MTIKHFKTEQHVCITISGHKIDAHWNMFQDMDAAKAYLEGGHMMRLPSAVYGFVEIKRTYWTEVPCT